MNEQPQDFADNPAGWAQRWKKEFVAAREALAKFRKTGLEVDKEFRGEVTAKNVNEVRIELFASIIQTKRAMMYGKTPQTTVTRRFADAKDDIARIAGEVLERNLNSDIERDSDCYKDALGNCLDDILLPGMGVMRFRYVAEFEPVPEKPAIKGPHPVTGEEVELAPLVPATERKVHEDVEKLYVHWDDFLFSAGGRVWRDVDWVAFRSPMRQDALIERFGKEIGGAIQFEKKSDDKTPDPWARADVWEIWHKGSKRVFWFVENHPTTLDDKKDPLGLEGFWPCPRPMMANLTTMKLVPRADYALAQDIYRQLNVLATRINELTDAIRVAGLYDETAVGVERLLTESGRNILIPVKNWAMLSEKGGIRGMVDWFPLEQVVNAIAVTQERMQVLQDQLFQVTGWSDIMRGEATQAGATATEQRIKNSYGSVRIQAMQDEFARFASDGQRIVGEIIAKHFDPETILKRSNAEYAFEDPMQVRQAIDLIKSDFSCYRIEVKPEAVAMSDFASEKAERLEVLQALGGFFTQMAPLAQAMPGSQPYIAEMAQWSIAGLRGASGIEGTLDRMIQAAKDAAEQAAMNPQQPPPDPKIEAERMKQQTVMMKGQQDMQKEQLKLQNSLVQGQAEVQNDAVREQNQRIENVKEAAQRQLAANMLKPPTIPGAPKR